MGTAKLRTIQQLKDTTIFHLARRSDAFATTSSCPFQFSKTIGFFHPLSNIALEILVPILFTISIAVDSEVHVSSV